MKTLTIHGASDDLVYALGIPGGDEFGAYINGRLFLGIESFFDQSEDNEP